MADPNNAPENTDNFDIQAGMAVYTADGLKFGSVMNIAGFGSTRIPKAGEHDTAEFVIQAKTSSGYFNVDRRDVQDITPTPPLCMPFYGIQEVVPGHGVILNDSIIEQLRHQRDPRPAGTILPPATPRRWRPKWL